MIYKARAGETEAVSAAELGGRARGRDADARRARRTSSQAPVVLGRSQGMRHPLDDPNVSRRHAEVRQEGATYWLVDLDSTNGTELNGNASRPS